MQIVEHIIHTKEKQWISDFIRLGGFGVVLEIFGRSYCNVKTFIEKVHINIV